MLEDKKLKPTQKYFYDRLKDMLVDADIISQEKIIFKKTLLEIERGGMFESHMINLRNRLLPLVINQKISKDSLEFYKELRQDRSVGLGQGDSLLYGLISETE